MKKQAIILQVFALTILVSCAPLSSDAPPKPFATKADLGAALFFDTSLSLNRTQSCSSCHSPQHAFVDASNRSGNGMASFGDDKKSLGDRNTPTITYAKFSSAFHKNEEGQYIGGQFYDGRASTLSDQAGGPPLNPLEMGLPDQATVVQRLQESSKYIEGFRQLFGKDIFDNSNQAFHAMTLAIEAFEQTELFAPFDSKYDRYLRGEAELSEQEDLGMTLFFSQQFTNCNICHQLQARQGMKNETFSNYEFHNIGVPTNQKLRELNGLDEDMIDEGLFSNPMVDDPAERGKFQVSTLRNIAVTGPYMHNGVFKDLRTVVLFYNKYNSKRKERQINPESGQPWLAPEIADNLAAEELETGPALDDKRIDALVAFMRTLTDKRYEHLLD